MKNFRAEKTTATTIYKSDDARYTLARTFTTEWDGSEDVASWIATPNGTYIPVVTHFWVCEIREDGAYIPFHSAGTNFEEAVQVFDIMQFSAKYFAVAA